MTDKIPVVVGRNESATQTLGLGDYVQDIIDIDADTLRQSLSSLTGQLGALFQDIKKIGDFKLDQVQVVSTTFLIFPPLPMKQSQQILT